MIVWFWKCKESCSWVKVANTPLSSTSRVQFLVSSWAHLFVSSDKQLQNSIRQSKQFFLNFRRKKEVFWDRFRIPGCMNSKHTPLNAACRQHTIIWVCEYDMSCSGLAGWICLNFVSSDSTWEDKARNTLLAQINMLEHRRLVPKHD